MKLSDLRVGDVAYLRSSNEDGDEVYKIVSKGWRFGDEIEIGELPKMFNNDMADLLDDSDYDIIKVTRDGEVIWEQSELQALRSKIDTAQKVWIARNEDNILVASASLLHRSNNEWVRYYGDAEYGPEYFLDDLWFPDLKWEDEPIQVVLLEVEVSDE